MHKYTKRDTSLVRKLNRGLILRSIRDKGTVSRAELAKCTDLNPATVSSIVEELLVAGMIEEVGYGQSHGGRRPKTSSRESAYRCRAH